MPSTNKTATLQLSQYVLEDKPTMADYNSDMANIDAGVAGLVSGTTKAGDADKLGGKAAESYAEVSYVDAQTTGKATQAQLDQHIGNQGVHSFTGLPAVSGLMVAQH